MKEDDTQADDLRPEYEFSAIEGGVIPGRNERELPQLLALGEKEIAAGGGHSLASVLKEADAVLKGQF